jgi:hypothetical protein
VAAGIAPSLAKGQQDELYPNFKVSLAYNDVLQVPAKLRYTFHVGIDFHSLNVDETWIWRKYILRLYGALAVTPTVQRKKEIAGKSWIEKP